MEEKFELLLKVMNTIDVRIVFVDADNKIVFFNRAAGEMLNIERFRYIETQFR